MKSIFPILLLPVLAFGQGPNYFPRNPVAAVGTTVTIRADRQVNFHLTGVGTISSAHGMTTDYTAPATVTSQHLLDGCSVAPNDSVFNTRIDNLPVHAQSRTWTPTVTSSGLSFSYGWGVTLVDNSTPVQAQQFSVTTQYNGTPFPTAPVSAQKRENGAYANDSTRAHHVVMLNHNSCQFYELNEQGVAQPQCPNCTAQSGYTYTGASYALPATGAGGGATDGGGLPLAPLTLHLSELQAGVINHALRFHACAECISASAIWPATTSNGLQPSAPPMGARFRLKANFDQSAFPPAAQVVLTALKRYGMILADTGATGQISVSTDVTENTAYVQQLQAIVAAALTYTDFEAVDESSLMLNASSNEVNPANPYETTANFAMLTLTDAAKPSNQVQVPIGILPDGIGTPDTSLVVQAGTGPFQIPHWGRGTGPLTWTLLPANAPGVMRGDGVYYAPAVVNAVTDIVAEAASSVNPALKIDIHIRLIPGGAIRIDSGSSSATTDPSGHAWMADFGFETSDSSSVTDPQPGSWNRSVNSSVLGTYTVTAGGDIVYRMHVPNGAYQVALNFGVGGCSGQFRGATLANGTSWGPLTLETQGAAVYSNWNFGTPINYNCRTPEMAFLPANVTDTTLTFAVRASAANGLHSAALLNSVTVTPIGGTASAALVSGPSPLAGSGPAVFPVQSFDPNCGNAGYNCRAAIQSAFGAISQAGGGTLSFPAGTFLIDFPEVLQNYPGSPYPLLASSLLVVPANTTIQGHIGADGTPDTMLTWKVSSVPVFVFAKSSNSSMHHLRMRYAGTMASAYPYGDVMLLQALGYNPTFNHQNQMSGSNAELFTGAFVFDSDNCAFDDMYFDSATQDNNHIIGGALNIKGKGVVVANGSGGLSQLANNNSITNMHVYDFNFGFTISGQNNFVMNNVIADRRGSTTAMAPGHLVYTTSTNVWDGSGNLLSTLLSTNVTIENLTEGSNTYSNVFSLGTLAIKFLNGATIKNVTSTHPEGLLQTIYADQNVSFSNMTWSSNYPLCTNYPGNCSTPAIYATGSAAGIPDTTNLSFTNVNVTSTASPTTVTVMGDNLTVNGMTIATLPTFLPNQQVPNAVLCVKGTNTGTITNYTYTPLIQSYNANTQYNAPFTGWNPTLNVSASMSILWPSSIAIPKAGSRIITPGYQNATPQSGNTVTSSVVLH